MRGKERFSAPEKARLQSVRFSAGTAKIPGQKPILGSNAFPAGLKSSFPLLKQGAATKSLPQTSSPSV
jgi:hypothetical protein